MPKIIKMSDKFGNETLMISFHVQYEISCTYNDAMDFFIRECQMRPVYGRQVTMKIGVGHYILGLQGLHSVLKIDQ